MKRKWNASVWVGLALVLAGVVSYPLFFIRYPTLRDFPWVNLPVIALGLILLGVGVARAFRRADIYRGKILGSVLGARGDRAGGILLLRDFRDGAPATGFAAALRRWDRQRRISLCRIQRTAR